MLKFFLCKKCPFLSVEPAPGGDGSVLGVVPVRDEEAGQGGRRVGGGGV